MNVWSDDENDLQWRLVWVTLKNAHFKGFNDPRTRKEILFDIEITGELNVSEIYKARIFIWNSIIVLKFDEARVVTLSEPKLCKFCAVGNRT